MPVGSAGGEMGLAVVTRAVSRACTDPLCSVETKNG